MEQLTTVESHESSPATTTPSNPLWARLAMPSVTDLMFVLLLCTLLSPFWSGKLLGDADTGWHIRNGEHILSIHSVPHADYFSYTSAGKPWFAWEWFYDTLIASVHSIAGLNGTVVFTAVVIAFTFALLFATAFRRSNNLIIALVFTLLSAAASSIHFLVRPHVVTWLFTLVWLLLLRSAHGGKHKALLWLPPLMILWTNLHGGFLIGLMLGCIFVIANTWTFLTTSCPIKRGETKTLALLMAGSTALSAVATLANPYGFRLWNHLRDYLGSPFLMNNIVEFRSPDFHWFQMKFFAALVLLSLTVLALHIGKIKVLDLLLVAFAVYAGLYAARNVPISAIILTLTVSPLATRALSDWSEQKSVTFSVRRYLSSLQSFTARMNSIERQLTGHLLPIFATLLAIAVSLNAGRFGPRKFLNAHFDAETMPVAATEYLVAHHPQSHVFAPDDWGGYLIYRMYPDMRLFIDDRHDFYGESFLRQYMEVVHLKPNWQNVLAQYDVNCVLVPADSPLASALALTDGWTLAYGDNTARIYTRNVRP